MNEKNIRLVTAESVRAGHHAHNRPLIEGEKTCAHIVKNATVDPERVPVFSESVNALGIPVEHALACNPEPAVLGKAVIVVVNAEIV